MDLFFLIFSDIELPDLPTQLANKLGCSVFTASILVSAIFLLTFILPVAIWGGKSSIFLGGILSFIVLGFCVAIGWLQTWFVIMLMLLTAGSFAYMWKGIGD